MKPPDEQPPLAEETDERFESGAREYAEYLRTVEGRLRLDIAWENFCSAAEGRRPGSDLAADAANRNAVSNVLRDEAQAARRAALDLGCGTGALSVRLARAGWRVAAADGSAAMIEAARESARREGCEGRIEFFRLEAAQAAEHFGPQKFDAVICHNVLEYVADPAAVVRAIGRVSRPSALVSLLARNRAGEALRDAVKRHDLDSAERALTAESVRESLYGGPARLFDALSLNGLASEAGLGTVALRGVRVVADYLPPALSETEEFYARLLAFELRLGARPDFAAVARYVQLLARARPPRGADAATINQGRPS
ncbi:MAG TPA: methyltransferase domain-containing protein [Pyrinomonadaceae bacterium]|nr:methyltransferase domain-containing protein [Pyrinomonadaceae bacterium]